MQIREQVHHRRNCWKRPKRGWLKCNVDSSFINSQTPCKAGWIIRDEDGFYKGAAQGLGRRVNNPFESEFSQIKRP